MTKTKTKKIALPKKHTDTYWDFHEVMHYLEKIHKKNFRDYAGKFSSGATQKRVQRIYTWMAANGYAGQEHVIDVPDPKQPNVDWPENSKEMKLRVEINTKFNAAGVQEDEVPYQDFWHWMIDQNEVSNGCWIYLPDWDYYMNNKETESWKKEIMQHFYDFLGKDYHERMWCEW